MTFDLSLFGLFDFWSQLRCSEKDRKSLGPAMKFDLSLFGLLVRPPCIAMYPEGVRLKRSVR
jgi:hypothetical protein